MKKGQSILVITLVGMLAIFGTSILSFSKAGQDKSGEEKGSGAVAWHQDQTPSAPNQFEITLAKLPILDYGAPEVQDPLEKRKRQIKSKRYDRPRSEPIREAGNVTGRVSTSHWEQGLPAIPVTQSEIILIVQVIDARAYLSNDKTDIYSEFNGLVEEVLKNDSADSVQPGASVTMEREGGAVRFPSGHIQRYIVSGQSPLQVSRRYVVFLNHTDKVFRNLVDKDENMFIITGYELRGDRVIPVDGRNATGVGKLAFDEFNDAEVSTFLAAVRNAIASSRTNGGGPLQ